MLKLGTEKRCAKKVKYRCRTVSVKSGGRKMACARGWQIVADWNGGSRGVSNGERTALKPCLWPMKRRVADPAAPDQVWTKHGKGPVSRRKPLHPQSSVSSMVSEEDQSHHDLGWRQASGSRVKFGNR